MQLFCVHSGRAHFNTILIYAFFCICIFYLLHVEKLIKEFEFLFIWSIITWISGVIDGLLTKYITANVFLQWTIECIIYSYIMATLSYINIMHIFLCLLVLNDKIYLKFIVLIYKSSILPYQCHLIKRHYSDLKSGRPFLCLFISVWLTGEAASATSSNLRFNLTITLIFSTTGIVYCNVLFEIPL